MPRHAPGVVVALLAALAAACAGSPATSPDGSSGTGSGQTPAPTATPAPTGSSSTGTSTSTSPSTSTATSTSTSTSASTTGSGTGTSTAPPACWTVRGGGTGRAAIADVRTGSAAGYDRLVIELTGPVTAYELVLNPNGTRFTETFSGAPVTLAGSVGAVLHLRNLDMPGAYPHGRDLVLQGPVLEEVRILGDFEGQADFGIGLGGGVCPVVSTMTGPNRLVIDFPVR